MLSQVLTAPSTLYNPSSLLSYNLSPTSLSDDMSLSAVPQYPKKAGKWTVEEDELLRKYVETHGEKQWRKISQHIPGRTSIQCLHRWSKILRPGLVKGPWTAEEDEKLVSWVRSEGANKWAQAASIIVGRSGKQCRERWFNNLNPEVKKGEWEKEEDELIYDLYQKHGSSWSKIAKLVPGRTENSIKNRFYSTLRKIAGDRKKIRPKFSPVETQQATDGEGETLSVSGECESAQQGSSTLYKLLQDNPQFFEKEKEGDFEDSSQKSPASLGSVSLAESLEFKQMLGRENSSPVSPQENKVVSGTSNSLLFNFNGNKILVRRDGSILRKDSQRNESNDCNGLDLKEGNGSQIVQKIPLNESNKLTNSTMFKEITPLVKYNSPMALNHIQQDIRNPVFNFSSAPQDIYIPKLSTFSLQNEKPRLSRQETCDLSNPIEIKIEDQRLHIPEPFGDFYVPKLAPLVVTEGFKFHNSSPKGFRLAQRRSSFSPINMKRLSSNAFQTEINENSSLSLPVVVEKRYPKENLDMNLDLGALQGLMTKKGISQDSHSTQVSESEMTESLGLAGNKHNEMLRSWRNLPLSNDLNIARSSYSDLVRMRQELNTRQEDVSDAQMIGLLKQLYSLENFLSNVNGQLMRLDNSVHIKENSNWKESLLAQAEVKIEASERNDGDIIMKKIRLH